jgi:hypothetical protein
MFTDYGRANANSPTGARTAVSQRSPACPTMVGRQSSFAIFRLLAVGMKYPGSERDNQHVLHKCLRETP